MCVVQWSVNPTMLQKVTDRCLHSSSAASFSAIMGVPLTPASFCSTSLTSPRFKRRTSFAFTAEAELVEMLLLLLCAEESPLAIAAFPSPLACGDVGCGEEAGLALAPFSFGAVVIPKGAWPAAAGPWASGFAVVVATAAGADGGGEGTDDGGADPVGCCCFCFSSSVLGFLDLDEPPKQPISVQTATGVPSSLACLAHGNGAKHVSRNHTHKLKTITPFW
mmetsp:Transcript_22429/g.61965  ORF Transcript_22429/g.61965 Transcript_22429/m.61965 type:complete len:221 (-) Transcript_22429:979-1641(-)